jgi:hypothetical protein
MKEASSEVKPNPVVEFFTSPLNGLHPAPMRLVADWLSAAGILLFAISVFALPWITVGIRDVLGIGKALGVDAPEKSYGLFVSPWAWLMVAVLLLMLAGLWFVQTRGAILLGAGAYCLIFNVIFYIGAWKKVNGIIGDVVGLARSIPVIGNMLGDILMELTKSMLNVHVALGFWLFVPAGVLLILGGALRLVKEAGGKEPAGPAWVAGA